MSALVLAVSNSNIILQSGGDIPCIAGGNLKSNIYGTFLKLKNRVRLRSGGHIGSKSRRGGGGDFWSKERSAKYLVIFDRKRRPPRARASTKGSHES